jgi:hypothetical protein
VPLGSCVLRPLTGRCRFNFRRPAQCPLGSYVFRKRRAHARLCSVFHFAATATLLAARRSPVRRSPLHHPSPVRNAIARAPACCSPVSPAARPPRARPSRSPPPRPPPQPPPRPVRPPAARSPRHHRLLGHLATAGCSGAPPQPSAQSPRRSRLIGRPATAARRFTVLSLQVTTSECLYLILY